MRSLTLLTTTTLSACALAFTPALAASLQGGGPAHPSYIYAAEFTAFNAGETSGKPTFPPYLPNVTSTIGQNAFVLDNFTCIQNASTGANNGACGPGPGTTGNIVQFGASDINLSSAQISIWATESFGQPAAANLIQLPSLGYGLAIPMVNAAMTKNGGATLSDADLCGIFSGKITNFSQITDAGITLTPGTITVVYQSGDADNSFQLTWHLNAVCTSANSAVTFTATSNFASLFTTLPANFVAASGARGAANTLASLSGTTITSAAGYLTPEYTSLFPASPVRLSNNNPSPLFVAALYQGKAKLLPTATNVIAGLAHPATGAALTAPSTPPAGANPVNWVPLISTTSSGYPIVGYTTLLAAQCYSFTDHASSTALTAFLKKHYGTGWVSLQKENGFVPVTKTFLTAIKANILANTNGWNINIGNTTACAELEGR